MVCGDVDDFARVNSSLGHEAGDDLLVSLAGRLQRELPVGCTAARLSGDEFVVICSDHAEVGGPDLLARTVADLLRTTITVLGRPVQLTASVGLATPAADGEVRAADLLRFAEAAMHDAKRRQCRGGIGLATDGVVTRPTRLELEAELRAAIAGDGLVLDYQPVVGPDGTVLSAEALVRWPHPVRGLIPPGDFLPVAQRSGLLRELDLWVLRTATREAAGLARARRAAQPSVAVNLAGLLPADIDFRRVSDIMADSGLPRTGWCWSWWRPAWSRCPRTPGRRWAGWWSGASGSPWTTSAPAIPRWAGSRSCPRRRSRSTGCSSPTSPTTRSTSRWPPPWLTWRQCDGSHHGGRGCRDRRAVPPAARPSGSTPYQGWLFAQGRCRPPELRLLLAGDRVAVPTGRGD